MGNHYKKGHKDIQDRTKENIEVWEDLVHIKHLVVSLLICSVTTLSGYFIAPNEAPKPLFFGLFGAFLGFLITSIIIPPKRNLNDAKEGE
ncbi:hypothetical protein [Sporosarcina sp. UB5]|uniref:hypothetical protein n=1 Tax=Sporosarcina sp. UB5 TaxID=3047463 RepID=UPI003D7BD244